MRHGSWALDRDVTFLNHGSFGARPTDVVEHQLALKERLESNPVLFIDEVLEEELDAARHMLADYLDLEVDGLVFVSNATTGVNTAIASIELAPGDEMIVTDHEYNACRNALDALASRTGATVVVVHIPFPIGRGAEVVEAIIDRVTPRTRLVLIDHVTSSTALVLPVQDVVTELEPDIPVIVDGAHAPGMVDPRVEGASFITGNCHKWLSAPLGAAFVWVRDDRRGDIDPLVISHGRNSRRQDRSRLWSQFDWTGTRDPSPWLCVPSAIESIGAMYHGGWPAIRARNRSLALKGRSMLVEEFGCAPMAPAEMIGSMATVALPDGAGEEPAGMVDELTRRLRHRHAVDIPIFVFPQWPRRVLRLSAHLYNDTGDFDHLIEALHSEL